MKNIWYAVMVDEEDGWDNGSEDFYEALKIAHDLGCYCKIAVIESEDDCDWWAEKVEEIEVIP